MWMCGCMMTGSNGLASRLLIEGPYTHNATGFSPRGHHAREEFNVLEFTDGPRKEMGSAHRGSNPKHQGSLVACRTPPNSTCLRSRS